jgi:hypothetical protein
MATLFTLSIFPPVAILTSFLSSAAFLVFLILFSHRPLRLKEESRFQAATIMAFILWLILLWLTGALSFQAPAALLNILAGGCIFAGALIIWWTFWTQIAWGFRLTMLVNLAIRQEPIPLDTWIEEYGGGRGKEGLLASRVEMLIRLRWASRTSNIVSLTPGWGEKCAQIAYHFRRLFALEDAR